MLNDRKNHTTKQVAKAKSMVTTGRSRKCENSSSYKYIGIDSEPVKSCTFVYVLNVFSFPSNSCRIDLLQISFLRFPDLAGCQCGAWRSWKLSRGKKRCKGCPMISKSREMISILQNIVIGYFVYRCLCLKYCTEHHYRYYLRYSI